MVHIPILRAGKPYKSLDAVRVKNFITGETVAELSQANSGLIRKDFMQASHHKAALDALPVHELVTMCKNAAALFMEADLPLDGETQSPGDFVKIQSATTGMPEILCRRNMEKIRKVLDEMETVLAGLTRGLDLSVLDVGWGKEDERSISYSVQTESLGAVLPNNSPGVHSLWLPSIPLKVPLTLKPGSQEPWTPYRVIQAFMAAGCPPEAFSYYPTDYSGATQILLQCGRSMFFGDESTVRRWEKDRRVQIHGPGWSKIIIGHDQISNWPQYIDVMVESILSNSGRSCLNASGVWVPTGRDGREIAEALAERLAQVTARAMDDPQAQLAAFVNPEIAERMSEMIDSGLRQGGAEEVTTKYRDTGRLVKQHGCTLLLPTIIWCDRPDHSLANTELLFPFASVVEVAPEDLIHAIGSSLVVTAITEESTFFQKLMSATNIDRLNFGPIPTNRISWDQPHEGNLFEHLYKQRAFQTTNENLTKE